MEVITKTIKVVIIDDEQLIIEGISSLLRQCQEIEIIGSTTKGNEALQLVKEKSPDVVLLDLRFKNEEIDGIGIAVNLIRDFPSLKILMLSSFDDFASIKQSFRKGVKGYLIKNTDRKELIKAIKTVNFGKSYMGPEVQRLFVRGLEEDDEVDNSKNNKEVEAYYPLTEREIEVSRLAAKGMERKEIADQLFISSNTVDTHMKRIYLKLGIKNIAALINWLIKKSLLEKVL